MKPTNRIAQYAIEMGMGAALALLAAFVAAACAFTGGVFVYQGF